MRLAVVGEDRDRQDGGQLQAAALRKDDRQDGHRSVLSIVPSHRRDLDQGPKKMKL